MKCEILINKELFGIATNLFRYISRIIMGSDRAKRRQYRTVSAEGPKAGAMHEAALPRKRLAGG